MRGYSTKGNQIAPKPPKLNSNDSQERNSNRNILKVSFNWLLRICRMILIVFGIYLMGSFFYYLDFRRFTICITKMLRVYNTILRITKKTYH